MRCTSVCTDRQCRPRRSSLPTSTLAADSGGAKKSGTTVTDKAQKGRGDADPNIKTAKPAANDPAAATKAPEKTRAGTCRVIVDNWTPWIVDVYVDGSYRGQGGRWGDDYTFAVAGITRIYARANFTEGTYLYWGPKDFNCPPGGSYTWKLNE